jgi:uncharacterized protein YgbK (DUF1537 family)
MTDSNLVRVLQRQTLRRVGLVSLCEIERRLAVRARFEALAREGVGVAIVDAVSDRHIDTIAAASRALRLVTGGAALGGALARHAGVRADERERPAITTSGSLAILSGSCSAATQTQVRRLGDRIAAQAVNPLKLVEDPREEGRLIDWAIGRGPWPLMLHRPATMRRSGRCRIAWAAPIWRSSSKRLATWHSPWRNMGFERS